MQFYVAELVSCEPYESETVAFALYGIDKKKLYELFCKKAKELYSDIDSWDWQGKYNNQSVTRMSVTWYISIYKLETVC